MISGMFGGQWVAGVTEALSRVPEIEVRAVPVGSAQIIAKCGGGDNAAANAALAALAEAGYTGRPVQPEAVSSCPSQNHPLHSDERTDTHGHRDRQPLHQQDRQEF